MENLTFIKEADFEKVFDGWRYREASDPGWVHCATKIKGWPDWESWRRFSADQIGAFTREWKIYRIDNPNAVIPNMQIGPYIGWQQFLPAKNIYTFSEMLEIPQCAERWAKDRKIIDIARNFPSPTEFIGFFRERVGRIVCFEGTHRSTAIAQSLKNGRRIAFKTLPTIALATLPENEDYLLDDMLLRGSSKDPSK